MTENKLQCYIKSVKHDTKDVFTTILPIVINGILLVGAVAVVAVIGYLITIGGRLLLEVSTPIIPVIMPYLSQYNLYLVVLLGVDICILYVTKVFMTSTGEEIKDPTGQIGLGLIVLFFVFFFNALPVSNSPLFNPPQFIGWTYMVWETAINAILLIIGIFLMRAYVRCEQSVKFNEIKL
jgi:hypothetical protein